MYRRLNDTPFFLIRGHEIENLEEPLQKLDRIQGDLDSLHSIIVGRLWKKDAVDLDTDRPTLQDLLRAIDKHLKPPDKPTEKPTLYKP